MTIYIGNEYLLSMIAHLTEGGNEVVTSTKALTEEQFRDALVGTEFVGTIDDHYMVLFLDGLLGKEVPFGRPPYTQLEPGDAIYLVYYGQWLPFGLGDITYEQFKHIRKLYFRVTVEPVKRLRKRRFWTKR